MTTAGLTSRLKLAVVCLLGCGLVLVWCWLLRPTTLPIRVVKISGHYQNIDEALVRSKAMPYVHRGFFSVNAAALRQELLDIPWVSDIAVTRVWPDTIHIKVQEKVAIAKWRQQQLVAADGEVFTPKPSQIPKGLPELAGPDDQTKTVLQHFVKMQRLLGTKGLTVAECHLTSRWSWWLQLDNGMVLMLGRKEPLARLQRFVDSYQAIFGSHATDALRVDLRYPSGIAVKWRGDTKPS